MKAILMMAGAALGTSVVLPNTAPAQQTADRQVASAPPTGQPAQRRTQLQQADLSIPGREVIQVRVEFDPGYVAPKHTHPGEEIIYVLEGTLLYEVEGREPRTYTPGAVLIVPYGVVHSVKNVGRGNGAELATYVVEKGKPLITLVK